jgi:ribonuclease-3
MDADLRAFCERLDYSFRRYDVLIRALTHKSHAAERLPADATAKNPDSDNEQLEFLGDSILGFLVSEALFERYPGFPEGKLSKLKSWLVSASHLHAVAEAVGLGSALRLGKGEEMSGGREKKAILANALEAVLAAIYLDGGMEAAREFVHGKLLARMGSDPDLLLPAGLADFKSALQERAQAMGLPQPKYVITGERGPEHAKTFTVEVSLGKALTARAEGGSKKDAGQRAAGKMIDQLEASESVSGTTHSL